MKFATISPKSIYSTLLFIKMSTRFSVFLSLRDLVTCKNISMLLVIWILIIPSYMQKWHKVKRKRCRWRWRGRETDKPATTKGMNNKWHTDSRQQHWKETEKERKNEGGRERERKHSFTIYAQQLHMNSHTYVYMVDIASKLDDDAECICAFSWLEFNTN